MCYYLSIIFGVQIMSKVKRCERCKGAKIVMRLGALEGKCPTCKGIGFEKKIEDKDTDSFLETKTEKKADKKPAKRTRLSK